MHYGKRDHEFRKCSSNPRFIVFTLSSISCHTFFQNMFLHLNPAFKKHNEAMQRFHLYIHTKGNEGSLLFLTLKGFKEEHVGVSYVYMCLP